MDRTAKVIKIGRDEVKKTSFESLAHRECSCVERFLCFGRYVLKLPCSFSIVLNTFQSKMSLFNLAITLFLFVFNGCYDKAAKNEFKSSRRSCTNKLVMKLTEESSGSVMI